VNQAFMESPLTASVLDFAKTLAGCTESRLAASLADGPEEGVPWHGYVDDAKSVSLFLNLQLNRLTSELRALQPPVRSAEICGQHHRAFRDLTGALAGIGEDDFEKSPSEGEWPLRTVIRHITGAELGFSLLIDWAVKRQAGGGDLSITMPQEEMAPHYEAFPETGTCDEMMDRYESLHRRVIDALLRLSSEQLEALNVWWEDYEIPVWFRMHRFDAHLREHTIQVDKTLAAIGRSPTEAERLARLLHQSLADLEVTLYVAEDSHQNRANELASEFDEWRRKLLLI
jgi:DinB superfamily